MTTQDRSWFARREHRPPPAPVSAATDPWPTCVACGRGRPASDVERYGVDIVICKAAASCITAAKVAGLWEGRS